ncbi:hypothetical protein GCM10027053_43870 [Intrasporangium mesophilum]
MSSANEEDSVGLMIFRRNRTWQDMIRKYTIEVDGHDVGRISSGGTLSVAVSPGIHACRAKISWTGSPVISVKVLQGRPAVVWVTPGRTGSLENAASEDQYLAISVEESGGD